MKVKERKQKMYYKKAPILNISTEKRQMIRNAYRTQSTTWYHRYSCDKGVGVGVTLTNFCPIQTFTLHLISHFITKANFQLLINFISFSWQITFISV